MFFLILWYLFLYQLVFVFYFIFSSLEELLEYLAIKYRNSREPFRIFHHCFFVFCFLFFEFFLLIVLFHVTIFLGPNGSSLVLSFTLTTLLGFCYFFVGSFVFVLLLLYHECCGFERAIFILRHSLFYITSPQLMQALPQPALSRFLCEPTVPSWRLQGFPLWFKTKAQPICLFELQNVPQTHDQQRVLFKHIKICW